jgi:RNA polymerase sigma-70 factor (ECF subfamily)
MSHDVGQRFDDAQLVERARRGEARAFEALVRRHYRAAYALAWGRLQNAMDAEDACQDAFLRALERLDDLEQPERFAAWLLRIVRNRAHNLGDYRRVRAARPLESELVAAPGGPDRHARRAELRARLEAALAELSEVQRQVILLHDLDGRMHGEVAEALGISEGMSRQHLMTARRLLRERLGARAIEEYSDD